MERDIADRIALYRQHAELAERSARQVNLDDQKAMLLEIARQWRRMADDLEKPRGG